MLYIQHNGKLIGQIFRAEINAEVKYWVVEQVLQTIDTYDIHIQCKMGIFDTEYRTLKISRDSKTSLGYYSVVIVDITGKLVNRTYLKIVNIETVDGMLDELTTIMEIRI